MLEGEGEGVFDVRESGGSEKGGGEREFIEEKRLAWGEEKPWYVKKGKGKRGWWN